MRASAAASSIGDLGLLCGLREIAIEIHSPIIMLYQYRADQCGQLDDRLGVTRRLLPYRPALGRRVGERLAPHYRRGQNGRAAGRERRWQEGYDSVGEVSDQKKQ